MTEPVQTVRLVSAVDDGLVAALEGKRLVDASYWTTLIGGQPVNYLRCDGSPLLCYRPRALTPDICRLARPSLRKAAHGPSKHRNMKVSQILGYWDRPMREAAFNLNYPRDYARCLPLICAASGMFQRALPDQYAAQLEIAQLVPDWVIANTIFTTGTVNRRTAKDDAWFAVHRDGNNLPDAYGVIAALTSGHYNGGYLGFPRYRTAVDMRDGDLLLFDPHEPHGNTPIAEAEPGWERISLVLYFRSGMLRHVRKA
jgi:hypothetical protein